MKTSIYFIDGLLKKNRNISFIQPINKNLIWLGDIIQDSQRDDKLDIFFDINLISSILNELKSRFKNIIVIDDKDNEYIFSNWLNIQSSMEELEREPPKSIKCYSESELELLIISEPWAYAGGPFPYHDSFSYSFFSINENLKILDIINILDPDLFMIDDLTNEAIKSELNNKSFLKNLLKKINPYH